VFYQREPSLVTTSPQMNAGKDAIKMKKQQFFTPNEYFFEPKVSKTQGNLIFSCHD